MYTLSALYVLKLLNVRFNLNSFIQICPETTLWINSAFHNLLKHYFPVLFQPLKVKGGDILDPLVFLIFLENSTTDRDFSTKFELFLFQ